MKFKDETSKNRFKDMHSQAQKLATEMDEWSITNCNKELTITATVSTVAEDKELQRATRPIRARLQTTTSFADSWPRFPGQIPFPPGGNRGHIRKKLHAGG